MITFIDYFTYHIASFKIMSSIGVMGGLTSNINNNPINHENTEKSNSVINIDPEHLDLTKLTTAVMGLGTNISEYLMQTFKDAYLKGLQSGYIIGYESGMKKGHQEGLLNGKKEGVELGKQQAILEARKRYAEVFDEFAPQQFNMLNGNNINPNQMANVNQMNNPNQMANVNQMANPSNFYGNRFY